MKAILLLLSLIALPALAADLVTIRDVSGRIVAIVEVPGAARDASGKITGTFTQADRATIVVRDKTGRITRTIKVGK